MSFIHPDAPARIRQGYGWRGAGSPSRGSVPYFGRDPWQPPSVPAEPHGERGVPHRRWSRPRPDRPPWEWLLHVRVFVVTAVAAAVAVVVILLVVLSWETLSLSTRTCCLSSGYNWCCCCFYYVAERRLFIFHRRIRYRHDTDTGATEVKVGSPLFQRDRASPAGRRHCRLLRGPFRLTEAARKKKREKRERIEFRKMRSVC